MPNVTGFFTVSLSVWLNAVPASSWALQHALLPTSWHGSGLVEAASMLEGILQGESKCETLLRHKASVVVFIFGLYD